MESRPGSQEDKWAGMARVQLRKENQVSEGFWETCLSTVRWAHLVWGVWDIRVRGDSEASGSSVLYSPGGDGSPPPPIVLAWRVPWTEEPGWLQSWAHRQLDTTEQLSTHSCLILC